MDSAKVVRVENPHCPFGRTPEDVRTFQLFDIQSNTSMQLTPEQVAQLNRPMFDELRNLLSEQQKNTEDSIALIRRFVWGIVTNEDHWKAKDGRKQRVREILENVGFGEEVVRMVTENEVGFGDSLQGLNEAI
uniref:Uncharacterized protein n=1 Tax=Caenorhabditis japonica TaxID=281687 RepID=A0A8R1I4Q9_CAEJA